MGRKGSVKNTIRSLRRLLDKFPERSKKRLHLEQQIEELTSRKDANKSKLREIKISKRYRGVRFIESQKLQRQISKLVREVEGIEDEEEKKLLEERLEKLRGDNEYARHFPRGEKYISVFREPDAESRKRRDRIRSEVLARIHEQAIVTDAGEGLDGRSASGAAAGVAIEDDDDFFLHDDAATEEESAPLGAVPSYTETRLLYDEGEQSFVEGRPRLASQAAAFSKERRASKRVARSEGGGGEEGKGEGVREGRVASRPPRPISGAEAPAKESIVVERARHKGNSKVKEKPKARTRAEGGRKRRRKNKEG